VFDFNLSCGRVDHGSVRDRQKEGTTPVVVVNEDWPALACCSVRFYYYSWLVLPGVPWRRMEGLLFAVVDAYSCLSFP
jgi:hypothetical protein